MKQDFSIFINALCTALLRKKRLVTVQSRRITKQIKLTTINYMCENNNERGGKEVHGRGVLKQGV